MSADDPRIKYGLFTVTEAAVYLGVPPSTFQTWVRGYERRSPGHKPVVGKAIVASVSVPLGHPNIPFIGLAEGLVLAAFRKAGVPLQRIRPALERLDQEIGLEHALASKRLYTDGAEVLYDFAAKDEEEAIRELVTVRSGQRVFIPVIRDYLRRITYAPDRWARQVVLPGYEAARVIVDVQRAFGRPIIESARLPVEEVVDRWLAGDSISELVRDFGLTQDHAEDVIRAATRVAAA